MMYFFAYIHSMKITYLLGAGASANALPTVKTNGLKPSLADSLNMMANFLEKELIDKTHKEFVNHLIKNFREIAHQSNRFGTPDTFAKSLYLQEKYKELDYLKEAIIFYFTIEQILNRKIDERPLVFLTTVMENQFTFPHQIKIISWNFDFQIQLAANEYQKEEFIVGAGASSHNRLISYYPSLGGSTDTNLQNDISMIQMNGIAGFYSKDSNIQNYFLKPPTDLNDLFKRIKDGYNHKTNLLTFAWEKNTVTGGLLRQRISIAKRLAAGTEILVVIGYSFPFFNREYDKEIFHAMKKSEIKLKRYIFKTLIAKENS